MKRRDVVRQAHRVHRDRLPIAGRARRRGPLGHGLGLGLGRTLALAMAILVAAAALSMTEIGVRGVSPSGGARTGAAMLDREAILGQTGGASETLPGVPIVPTEPAGTASPQPSGPGPSVSVQPTPTTAPTSSPSSRRPAGALDREARSTTLQSVAATPVQHPAAPLRTVALGDSLTAWPGGNPWPSRVDAADPYVTLVNNAGVPGNTTAQMRARFGSDVVPYAPDLVLVLGGTNDVGTGVGQATTIANLRAIVRAAKAQGMRVVLLTIPPDSYSSYVGRVQALNSAIRSLAASEGVPLIDIYWSLATPGGVYRAGYTVDGLHFSDAGAQVVANTIRGGLARLGF